MKIINNHRVGLRFHLVAKTVYVQYNTMITQHIDELIEIQESENYKIYYLYSRHNGTNCNLDLRLKFG